MKPVAPVTKYELTLPCLSLVGCRQVQKLKAPRPAAPPAAPLRNDSEKAEPRLTRFSYSFSWIVSRTRSDSSKTSERSSAASGPYPETSIGGQNSIRHFEGSGTVPSRPSAGKVGVIGK